MPIKIFQIIGGNKKDGYKILREFDDYEIIDDIIDEVNEILKNTENGMKYIFDKNKLLWSYDDKYIRIEIFTIHPSKIIYSVCDSKSWCGSCSILDGYDNLDDIIKSVELMLKDVKYTFDKEKLRWQFNDEKNHYYYIHTEGIYNE